MENTYRLNMYVAESDVEILDFRRAELGMSRSEFVRYMIRNQKRIVPVSIKEKELIRVLSDIDTHLKVIALKEILSVEDRLFLYSEIDEIKNLLGKEVTCAPVEHKLKGGKPW